MDRLNLVIPVTGCNNSNDDEFMHSAKSPSTYIATTRGIEVSVHPTFLDNQSDEDEDEDHYVWAYTIKIVNRSDVTVQLKHRYWLITDANGKNENVQGPGVVGEQPILNPGDEFQYTSGCPLTTPSGFMVGQYTMRCDNGEEFKIDIPAFALDLPNANRTMN